METKIKSQVATEGRLNLGKVIPLKTPLVIYVELSGYCNLKCIFCPHNIYSKEIKKDLMTIETFKKMIEDLKKFPDKIKLLRICGNGENLLNKDIIEMLKYAKENNIAEKIQLITNCTLLNDYLIQNLPKYLDMMVCSIEGLSSEDYKRISGIDLNYDELLKNIYSLYKNKGNCLINIKTNNLAANTEERKKIFFDTFFNYCDEIYVENVVPMYPQFKYVSYDKEFRFRGDIIERKICPQIFKSLQVQADGDVLPCCVDWRRINIMGNINESSLFEIWNDKKMKNLQIIHLNGNRKNINPCKDCLMNEYCEIDDIDLYKEEILTKMGVKNESK